VGKPERRVEDYLVRQVNAAGGLCWKFVSPALAGVPDRIVILNGVVVFVEVKTPGGKPTKLQMFRLKQIIDAGGLARVIDSREGVDELIDALNAGTQS
jgi:hypothetical protein